MDWLLSLLWPNVDSITAQIRSLEARLAALCERKTSERVYYQAQADAAEVEASRANRISGRLKDLLE